MDMDTMHTHVHAYTGINMYYSKKGKYLHI